MSVTFILQCQVRPDSVEPFKERLTGSIPVTRAFDGCEGLEVLQDQDQPTTFVLVERWASREHQQRYAEWRRTRGELGSLDALLEHRSRRFLDNTGI